MTDRIEFTIPFALPSLNVRDRQHWVKRMRQKANIKLHVLSALGGTACLPRPAWPRARVTITRRSLGQLDQDNLYGSAKPLVDCLCVKLGWGIVEDDSPDHMTLLVQQAPAKRGHGSTRVTIERIA